MNFKPELSDSYSIHEGPLIVEKLHVMGGANYFSAGPVVLIRLNLGIYNEVTTNQIPDFFEKLKTRVPSLHDHFCSEGKPGGFFMRVQEGTLLGHVTEHVAIELQTLAGMDVAYGKTRSTLQEGVFNIIFRFFDKAAGIYCAKAAVNLINSILLNQEFNVAEVIRNLELIREHRLLGPSTQAIVNEATKRGIPFLRLDQYNLIQLGTGCYQKRLRATITSDTNMLAVETADNKFLTYQILDDAGIPVPLTIRTDNPDEAVRFFKTTQKPITIKPCDGNLGKKIHLNLSNEADIISACNEVAGTEEEAIVQTFVPGKIFRLLVIDYKLAAAVQLTPPFIIGNGTDNISKLIENLNQEPERRFGDKSPLSCIEMDEVTLQLLKDAELTTESILEKDRVFSLKTSGNPRLGGISEDVTDIVHPKNVFFAERACKAIGLNVGGVDIIAPSIDTPISENGGIVIEVNAAPDFRMHLYPAKGESRNVAANLVTMLFPAESKNHIPLFSVTGTVGKTTTAFLLDFCLRNEGYYTGLSTTEGLFINGNLLKEGDMTAPEHVGMVLKDASINCAVLETSREGILRNGLGYQFADCGIFLNIHDEHIGFDDIKYIEDLAYAKSVVAEEVYETGFSVLNANSELTLDVIKRLYSTPVLFSVNPNLPTVKKQIESGKICVTLSGTLIEIISNKNRIPLISLKEIPLMYNNTATFMLENILATVASLYSFGILPERIADGLRKFKPDYLSLPGRLNHYQANGFDVFLDYAHNETALAGLISFASQYTGRKILAMDATGDRTDDEIKRLGQMAAEAFDEINFYEGDDRRNRQPGEIISLLKEGAGLVVEKNCIISFSEKSDEAIRNALEKGSPGFAVFILSGRPFFADNIIHSFIDSNKI
ncbi:MAG: cyanophycin synthetase [Bacteroidota bacterium]